MAMQSQSPRLLVLDDDRAIMHFRKLPAIRVEQEARKAASFKSSGAVPFLVGIYNKKLKTNKLQIAPPKVSEHEIRESSSDKPSESEGAD